MQRESVPAALAWTYLRGEDYTRPAVVDALLALPGVTDVVPAYDSTFVEFDPGRLRREEIVAVAERAGAVEHATPSREIELPVLYGGEHGPDLEGVAERAGLSTTAAAELHASAEYVVRALGFAPGFPFMTGIPEPLRSPRRGAPRRLVPAHSVGIAGHQTGVYPVETPGGWNLIGRTLDALYDPHRDEPFLLGVGDRVRFRVATPGASVAPPPPPEPLSLLPEEPAIPAFSVLEAGLHDIVVDGGRFRVGRFGLARSGPVDAPSARLANQLVGNEPGAPVIEMTLTGPVLEALADAVIAVAGSALEPVVCGDTAEPYRGLLVKAGTELRFRPSDRGARSYLAVAGGVQLGEFLGSSSTDSRGLIGRPLREGDVLGLPARRSVVAGRSFAPYTRRYEVRPTSTSTRPERPLSSRPVVRIRLLPGPQHDPSAWVALLSGEFTVSAADRVGLRLSGPPVPGGEVTSEGTPIGAVQVPPGGGPMVLLQDRGTLGGYAKPAVVHPRDLPVLGQLREADTLRFVAGI